MAKQPKAHEFDTGYPPPKVDTGSCLSRRHIFFIMTSMHRLLDVNLHCLEKEKKDVCSQMCALNRTLKVIYIYRYT